MAIQIDALFINDGDPVTSDLLKALIKNVNTVAKGETVANVPVNASDLANQVDGAKISTAYNTVLVVPSSVKVSSAPGKVNPKLVKFNRTFVGIPEVWVQMDAVDSFANSQIFPQVVSVGSESCNINFRTGTANGTVKFKLFAAGQLSS